MSESGPGYFAGAAEPLHHWVECSVRVPDTDGGETEIQCKAKVRCDDVIDALDLGRWSAVAFQHLWRSAIGQGRRHIGLAIWYLKRANQGHNAEGRTVAAILRRVVEMAKQEEVDVERRILQFAREAEDAEFSAVELIHHAETQDI